MRRGDVVISADPAAGGYGTKPRPHIVVQADAFAATESVTLCPVTTTLVQADTMRIGIAPNARNGLKQASWIMADKIMTVRRARVAKIVGRIGADDMNRLDLALMTFLGLA